MVKEVIIYFFETGEISKVIDLQTGQEIFWQAVSDTEE